MAEVAWLVLVVRLHGCQSSFISRPALPSHSLSSSPPAIAHTPAGVQFRESMHRSLTTRLRGLDPPSTAVTAVTTVRVGRQLGSQHRHGQLTTRRVIGLCWYSKVHDTSSRRKI